MSASDREDDEARRRSRKIWLTVAFPPLIMLVLGMALGIEALYFVSLLWAVGLTAIALGYPGRRAVEKPAPQNSLPPAGTSRSVADVSGAIVRVAAVKAEFGSLLSDIVYRIENSALFDDAAALTREFQLALIRWDDAQAEGDPATMQRVAAEVELSFRTARSHAETVGLSHLPATAQPRAERALKAARLGKSAESRSEREAALAQVARLLDSLALYYLPSSVEVPHMLGGAHRELEL